VKEPTEIIIVVNGSAEEKYSRLRSLYPAVQWLFFSQPLGFTGAVLKGIDKAQQGAIYLLNDDMVLEPEALVTSLSWRGPQFFGVASQIFLQDSERRREETGWTAMPFSNGLPMPRHEVPLGPHARGTVWAGAGSALYHAGLLRELMPGCKPFDPFYWEDVDLGIRAWRRGYESLICPSSIAWHKHRATVEKIFSAQEVNRIFERNRLLFQLRNPFPRPPLVKTLEHVARIDELEVEDFLLARHDRSLEVKF
jgi:GT2 family glycosyltransferase